MLLFLKGLSMGIIVAMAPGPMLAILLKEGVLRGYKFALRFGMGISVVDMVYCLLAFLGISPFLASYPKFIPFLWISAACFFIVLGVKDIVTFLKKRSQASQIEVPEQYKETNKNPFVQGLLISIVNPGAFIYWIGVSAIFSHLGLADSTLLILGIAFGCPLWFFILANIIARVRGSFTKKFFYYFNLVAGIALVITGFYFSYKFFKF